MFSKAAIFIVSTLALVVASAPAKSNVVSSCNANNIYCCNSIQNGDSFNKEQLMSFFSAVGAFSSVSGQWGVTCAAGSGAGGAGNSCSQQTACCTGKNYSNGAFVASCSPFNANA